MQDDIFLIEDEKSIPIEIRYEGKYADHHVIPMSALAESLDGFGRIYAVAGHFVSTGEYALQLQALNAKVLITEHKAKCFSVIGALEWVSSNGLFSGSVGAVFAAVVSVIFTRSRGSQEEMKHLRDLFEQQLGHNQETTQRLLDTVDRLAVALQPSAKKSVAPIGEACERIELYASGKKSLEMDISDKDAMYCSETDTITDTKVYTIIISELDKVKRSCKASFTIRDSEQDCDDGGSTRVSCEITDPVAMINPNPYIEAFSSGHPLEVKAKALIKDGVISKLYISDAL